MQCLAKSRFAALAAFERASASFSGDASAPIGPVTRNAGALAAVTTLQRLAVDSNVPPAVRARAAFYILTLSKQSIEIDDIDARVAELERAAEDAKNNRR
jgi:hypothetical protein